jgi:acyl-CoA thioesterase-2
MGDFAVDTAVDGANGTYRATLSRDWEIWGPMGGYIATFALRAAAAESAFERPASFFCHYLGVAGFDDPIDLAVRKLRSGRTAESMQISITQGLRAILEATVWTVGEVDGLEHVLTAPPVVKGPDGLPNMGELFADDPDAGPPFPFWNNFEVRPIGFHREWPPTEPLDPVWQEWIRFIPTSTFDDPWVDAGRALVGIDIQSWPAASRPHVWKQPNVIAPSMDLYVAFHDAAPYDPWLLADGHSTWAAGGLMNWTGNLWASNRSLVASGMGQLLCRTVPAPPP